ncbi:hypothetical protein KP12_356 [Klebsiella phage KP12]|uniref:Uncharacterized protein n=1 Tax=Klebsiella phage KP12 TaxID=2923374 RepID=A0A9E6YZT6_9CAUD|nr:hypothetical protein KP12_356 [Klebsiella phage KP12]
MQYLYVDPSDDVNKPIPSAFKTVTAAIAAITSYPFSILIRRGTVLKEAVNAELVNTSSEMSFLDAYGDGPPPNGCPPQTRRGNSHRGTPAHHGTEHSLYGQR